jgi:ABC-type branched-subunit amino acid transport system substrate-binding protein
MLARGRAAAVGVIGALALAGCGTATTSGGSSGITVTGRNLDVYASQPPGTPTSVATDTLDAERLALAENGGRVGEFTVRLTILHGSELSANARSAIQDQSAIAYLGELQPGTSQISVEILNQQDLLQISPADTAAYLTQPVPGVSPSADGFYPDRSTYHRTFARTVPTSAVETKAIAATMHAQHATSLFVGNDSSLYGRTVTVEMEQAARSAGLQIASAPATAGAIFYGASLGDPAGRTAATQFFDRMAGSAPHARLYAPSGLYEPTFVSGLSSSAQARLYVSSPGFLPADLPAGGKTFATQFARQYGHQPEPPAVFGFEAMSALLATLKEAGSKANQRSTVVSDFRSLKRTDSPVGSYTISGGDPSLTAFVIARVRNGALAPFKSVSAG